MNSLCNGLREQILFAQQQCRQARLLEDPLRLASIQHQCSQQFVIMNIQGNQVSQAYLDAMRALQEKLNDLKARFSQYEKKSSQKVGQLEDIIQKLKQDANQRKKLLKKQELKRKQTEHSLQRLQKQLLKNSKQLDLTILDQRKAVANSESVESKLAQQKARNENLQAKILKLQADLDNEKESHQKSIRSLQTNLNQQRNAAKKIQSQLQSALERQRNQMQLKFNQSKASQETRIQALNDQILLLQEERRQRNKNFKRIMSSNGQFIKKVNEKEGTICSSSVYYPLTAQHSSQDKQNIVVRGFEARGTAVKEDYQDSFFKRKTQTVGR